MSPIATRRAARAAWLLAPIERAAPLFLVASSLLAGCRCEPPPRTEIPSYRVRRATTPPAIDGDLSEWSEVPETEPFVDTMGGGAMPTRATARMQWDERALYVAFEIQDTFLASRFEAHDDHLWEADCAELMIDRGGDGLAYAELQVSPTNVVFDTWFDTYRAPQPLGHLGWSADLETAVRARGTPNDEGDDQGYDVEMAIPWAALARVGTGSAADATPPRAGEEWRIALYVLDLLREGATGSGWSPPLVGDFHVPDRFGRVVLSEE